MRDVHDLSDVVFRVVQGYGGDRPSDRCSLAPFLCPRTVLLFMASLAVLYLCFVRPRQPVYCLLSGLLVT